MDFLYFSSIQRPHILPAHTGREKIREREEREEEERESKTREGREKSEEDEGGKTFYRTCTQATYNHNT